MFKEIAICIVVIFAVIVGNTITQGYTKKSTEKISSELITLREELNVDQINQQDVESRISSIYDNWNEVQSKMACFIEHDELEKVETELTAIKGNIEVNRGTETVQDIDKCIFILNHIKDKGAVKIQNIF